MTAAPSARKANGKDQIDYNHMSDALLSKFEKENKRVEEYKMKQLSVLQAKLDRHEQGIVT